MPRDMEDESNVFGMEEGCPEHGSEHLAECNVCGAEFCTRCYPRSAVCADCADDDTLEGEARSEDFDDVEKIDKILDAEETDKPGAAGDDDESP